MHFTGLRPIGAVLDGTPLDLGDLGRHADDHTRTNPALAFVRLADEVTKHSLSGLEVGDDSIAHRLDGRDVGRRATEHLLRFVTDGFDLRVGGVEGDDRRLAEHDAAATGKHTRVRGAKVDRQVI